MCHARNGKIQTVDLTMREIPERRNLRGIPHVLRWTFLCLIAQATTVFGINLNVSLVSLTNHNTSVFSAYKSNNFPPNFGPTSWVSQSGTTIPADPSKVDESLNPITPGH